MWDPSGPRLQSRYRFSGTTSLLRHLTNLPMSWSQTGQGPGGSRQIEAGSLHPLLSFIDSRLLNSVAIEMENKQKNKVGRGFETVTQQL